MPIGWPLAPPPCRVARSAPRARWAWPALVLAALVPGCGASSVAGEQPWFCQVQGTDADDTVRLMQRRATDRSPAAAARVLETDDWRGCWGNAALLLGAHGPSADPAADPAVILARADELAHEPQSDHSVLELDAILAGYALSARQSRDPKRVEQVVSALVARADPAWWLARDPTDHARRDEGPRIARIRARSALIALAWSGTRPAERALVALRDDPGITDRIGDDARTLLSDLIRECRAALDQPPGQRR